VVRGAVWGVLMCGGDALPAGIARCAGVGSRPIWHGWRLTHVMKGVYESVAILLVFSIVVMIGARCEVDS